ncbi:MAG: DUF2905 domain-containing protein [Cyclobacteriaceae bacterium]|nr:DUF2905 domain-containing protein [Cyclobacteriaceae bacterium]
MQSAGKYIILIGIILVILGLIVHFAGNSLNWLGRLPGDIRIEKENHRVYIPVTSMILISIILTIIINLIRKFFL